MAERLGIPNVSFAQADLLRLGERADLHGRFALIESVGVLHHLADPLAGWAALRRLLRQDGIMKIGLYSDPARAGIVAAREWLAERGFAPTPDGIRAARRAIIDLPAGHPARRAMLSHDFHAASGFRDLLMHVQEHRFTTERLAASLDRLGLRFLGFELDVDVLERFRDQFPAPGADLDLACWGAFEAANPDTFAAMYTFWCCPDR
jgi:SAM-dependent methyltransferase